MMVRSWNQTWMQSIKNRKLKKRVHRVGFLPSDGFKAFIQDMPKMGLSVEHDGLSLICWVFNMMVRSWNQTWMQIIKNRKLTKRVHRNFGFFYRLTASKPLSTICKNGPFSWTWWTCHYRWWVFNMLLGSSNQTWMQSIKNRKLKKRVHRNCGFFLPSDGFKALIHHKPKRQFQLNLIDFP